MPYRPQLLGEPNVGNLLSFAQFHPGTVGGSGLESFEEVAGEHAVDSLERE